MRNKLLRQINRWLPLVISAISLVFSAYALRDQTQQSKTQLWQDYRHEWDRDLKPERIAFADAFLRRVNENEQNGDMTKEKHDDMRVEYGHVMTFFETLGFLVHSRRMDESVFSETFSYDFIAYFNACKDLLAKDD